MTSNIFVIEPRNSYITLTKEQEEQHENTRIMIYLTHEVRYHSMDVVFRYNLAKLIKQTHHDPHRPPRNGARRRRNGLGLCSRGKVRHVVVESRRHRNGDVPLPRTGQSPRRVFSRLPLKEGEGERRRGVEPTLAPPAAAGPRNILIVAASGRLRCLGRQELRDTPAGPRRGWYGAMSDGDSRGGVDERLLEGSDLLPRGRSSLSSNRGLISLVAIVLNLHVGR
jgi:hypothetical protein